MDKEKSEAQVQEETVSQIKKILSQFRKDQNNYSEMMIKNETISNAMKGSLELINPDGEERITKLVKEIDDYITESKLEMNTIKHAVKQLTENASADKLRKQQFKEKIHVYRESDLTVAFSREKEIRSLCFICNTMLFWFGIWVIVNDVETFGHPINYMFWSKAWSGLPKFFKLHAIISLYSFIIILFIQLVRYLANKFNKINYLALFIVYGIIQSVIPIFILSTFPGSDVGFPAGMCMGAETVRIMLKMHSYFREKILYGLKEYHMEYATFSPSSRNTSNELIDINIESFFVEMKRYIYFYFCPSLIYRDSYPRLPKFRFWSFLSQLFNFLSSFFFFYIFVMYICKPYFDVRHVKNYYSLLHFASDSLYLALPSTLFLMMGFFLLLHSWMNLWSEILCYGDRRFYEDWWNCTNFEQYYRKWNMVVHEWLYYYIYNDTRRLSLGKCSRFLSKCVVFLVSVTIHEIILDMGIGFVYPVLSFFFGVPGIIFTYIKTTNKAYNILFWVEMLLGPGIIVVLYLWEFNLRQVFQEIPFEKPWHRFFPRIILMFFEFYKKKLLALSDK